MRNAVEKVLIKICGWKKLIPHGKWAFLYLQNPHTQPVDKIFRLNYDSRDLLVITNH